MADQFYIMPAEDLKKFDKVKYKDKKPTKTPHNAKSEIQPFKLKDRPEYGIPFVVATKDIFKKMHSKLKSYPTEMLEEEAFEYFYLEVPPV